MLFPSQFFIYNYTGIFKSNFFQYDYRLHMQKILYVHVYSRLTYILF